MAELEGDAITDSRSWSAATRTLLLTCSEAVFFRSCRPTIGRSFSTDRSFEWRRSASCRGVSMRSTAVVGPRGRCGAVARASPPRAAATTTAAPAAAATARRLSRAPASSGLRLARRHGQEGRRAGGDGRRRGGQARRPRRSGSSTSSARIESAQRAGAHLHRRRPSSSAGRSYSATRRATRPSWRAAADSLLDQNVDVLIVELASSRRSIQAAAEQGQEAERPGRAVSARWRRPRCVARHLLPGRDEGRPGADRLPHEEAQRLPDGNVRSRSSTTTPPAVVDGPHGHAAQGVKAQDKVKIAGDSTTDAATSSQGTRKTVDDQITHTPTSKAFWFALRHGRPGRRPGRPRQVPGKTFPDKPLVVTFHADLGTAGPDARGRDRRGLRRPTYDAAAGSRSTRSPSSGAATPSRPRTRSPLPGIGDRSTTT